jgi:predicted RNA-binding Zn-ribbon protein involved in translation (DUF1610 family)
MGSRLIRQVWCDHHQAVQQEEREATTHTVAIDGAQVEIDLCPECLVPLEELATFLAAYGRAGGGSDGGKRKQQKRHATKDTPGAVLCPECGKALGTAKSLRQHLVRQHGLSGPASRELTSPSGAASRELTSPPEELPSFTCPECGFVAKTGQGLATHRTRKHQAR